MAHLGTPTGLHQEGPSPIKTGATRCKDGLKDGANRLGEPDCQSFAPSFVSVSFGAWGWEL